MLTAALVLVVDVAAAPLSAQLVVEQVSWRGGTFDAAGFGKRCAATGVRLVSEATDHRVRLIYREERGPNVFWQGGPPQGTPGTVVSFDLEVLAPPAPQRVAALSGSYANHTTYFGSKETLRSPAKLETMLYESARRFFAESVEWRQACSLIAAALGVEAESRRILRWAVVDPAGLRALKTLSRPPRDATERAAMAVAESRFADRSVFGPEAVEFLDLWLQARMGRGEGAPEFGPHIDFIGPNAHVGVRNALAALGLLIELDRKRAADTLPSMLSSMHWKRSMDGDHETTPLMLAVIERIDEFGLACKAGRSMQDVSRRQDRAGAAARQVLARAGCPAAKSF